jgi:hypothetical protein
LNFLEIAAFAAVMWLGTFVLARDPGNGLMRNTGLGILAYATALMFQFSSQLPAAPEIAERLFWALLVLPPYFWTGTVIDLAGESAGTENRLRATWRLAGVLVILLPPSLLLPTPLWPSTNEVPEITGVTIILLINLLPLIALICKSRMILAARPGRAGIAALVAATLFFTLGIGLLLFPLGRLAPQWIFLAIALDFELLGLAILKFDAFDNGERVGPDFLRALAFGLLLGILFGGQIAFVIALSTGYTFTMSLVLHLTISAAFMVAMFIDPIQSAIEGLVFRNRPGWKSQQSELRAVAKVQLRRDPHLDPLSLDEERFIRLTRRALSHFGDLAKLASNPLTNLTLIDKRLADHSHGANTLVRARELKHLLSESVQRLKPAAPEGFGESDEWRYYNVLYFPYIVGLRPYSRRARMEDLEPEQRRALNWFRSQVPERTLYNWQATAAGLVARDLLERSARLGLTDREGDNHAPV